MNKVFFRVLHNGNNLKLFSSLPNLIKKNGESLKLFSVSNTSFQEHSYHNQSKPKNDLPNLFYIQNPITWLINKLDFFMLRKAWDPEFVEKDFKRGVKQAMSVICTLISSKLWSQLRGLVTSHTLSRLQRDVEFNWSEDKRKNIAVDPTDIQLVLTRKVHFLKVAGQKFVDVDVICVAVKFRDEPLPDADIIIIEVLARFHRNYTLGQIPNWTVTAFKVSTQNVKIKGEIGVTHWIRDCPALEEERKGLAEEWKEMYNGGED